FVFVGATVRLRRCNTNQTPAPNTHNNNNAPTLTPTIAPTRLVRRSRARGTGVGTTCTGAPSPNGALSPGGVVADETSLVIEVLSSCAETEVSGALAVVVCPARAVRTTGIVISPLSPTFSSSLKPGGGIVKLTGKSGAAGAG